MKNGTSPKDLSLAAAFWFVGSLTLPIVAFCLLREAFPQAAYSERSTRVVWLTWTGLATAVLPVWHLWLHLWRAEGSFANRFHSVVETSRRRIWALFVFVLPLLLVVAAEANSDLVGLCIFLWIVGLFVLVCRVLLLLMGELDAPDDRQTVDLRALANNHMNYWKGTISLRKGGFRF